MRLPLCCVTQSAVRVAGTVHNFSAFAWSCLQRILAQFLFGNESLPGRAGFKCWYRPFPHRSPATKRENFRVFNYDGSCERVLNIGFPRELTE